MAATMRFGGVPAALSVVVLMTFKIARATLTEVLEK